MTDNMYTPTPVAVHGNIVRMLDYRGATLISPVVDDAALMQKLNHFEYIMMTATRNGHHVLPNAILAIALLAPDSKYSARVPEFKKLLKEVTVLGETTAKSGKHGTRPLVEIIIVSHADMASNISKFLEVHRGTLENMLIDCYIYKHFLIEYPRCSCFNKHTIMTNEEVAAFERAFYTSRDKFPTLSRGDTAAVWYGVRPGMVVYIDRLSETAGTQIGYRTCK